MSAAAYCSRTVKLLIFAHTPPPHHGQSYMVQLLLDALGGDARLAPSSDGPAGSITCYHLNARYSSGADDIGRVRIGKLFLVLRYSILAIYWRFRFGLDCLYYVPAFPRRAPIYRDWIALGLCRPFFKKTIYHWHAVGLGEWLSREARPWERWITQRTVGFPDVSVVLRPYNRADAEHLGPKRIDVVSNGIPDPCPRFDVEVLPRRLARIAARGRLLAGQPLGASELAAAGADAHIFRVLFLGLCYSGKGLFDAVEAIAIAHQQLRGSRVRVRLTVAGPFRSAAERAEFDQRIQRPDLNDAGEPIVEYRGFVSGAAKERVLVDSDCLCFLTRMPESFGLVLLEGMAFGLPLIATDWRNLPEILPPKARGIVEPHAPHQIAAAIVDHLTAGYDPQLRSWFVAHYTDVKFAQNMKRVLLSV
jgi:glycosyltransferase involved in cell wall biosynthesis